MILILLIGYYTYVVQYYFILRYYISVMWMGKQDGLNIYVLLQLGSNMVNLVVVTLEQMYIYAKSIIKLANKFIINISATNYLFLKFNFVYAEFIYFLKPFWFLLY